MSVEQDVEEIRRQAEEAFRKLERIDLLLRLNRAARFLADWGARAALIAAAAAALLLAPHPYRFAAAAALIAGVAKEVTQLAGR